jgi:hypothetical protein
MHCMTHVLLPVATACHATGATVCMVWELHKCAWKMDANEQRCYHTHCIELDYAGVEQHDPVLARVREPALALQLPFPQQTNHRHPP